MVSVTKQHIYCSYCNSNRWFAGDMNEVKLFKLAFQISPGLNVTFTTFSLKSFQSGPGVYLESGLKLHSQMFITTHLKEDFKRQVSLQKHPFTSFSVPLSFFKSI